MWSWAEPDSLDPTLCLAKGALRLDVQETPGCVAERVAIKVNGKYDSGGSAR